MCQSYNRDIVSDCTRRDSGPDGRTVQHLATDMRQYFCTRGNSPGPLSDSGQICSTQSSCLQSSMSLRSGELRAIGIGNTYRTSAGATTSLLKGLSLTSNEMTLRTLSRFGSV